MTDTLTTTNPMTEYSMEMTQQNVWLAGLTREQYKCVVDTLQDISNTGKQNYDVTHFPEYFIKNFEEAFLRKEWVAKLSTEQLEIIKSELSRESYMCPNLACCGCCQNCNGDGRITYEIHNFPVSWIEKYKKELN